MHHPKTTKQNVIDTYFGIEVPDPYRWLEDDRSEATKHWVTSQNEYTKSYLDTIPFKAQLYKRLAHLWNYEKISAPFRAGTYTYYYKNDGLQQQAVLYRYQNKNDPPELFLDPNTFSASGTSSLGQIQFSKDGSLAVYTISKGGSDWRTAYIINTKTKQDIDTPLTQLKFTGLSWQGNTGFFYASYDHPDGSMHVAKTDHHKLYYHSIGTAQDEDALVFGGNPEEKYRYLFAKVTEDERYLVLSAMKSTSGNLLFIKDLKQPNSKFTTILDHDHSDTACLTNQGSTLYLVTNLEAPNKKIITVDANQPTPAHWKDCIPETKHAMQATTGGNTIFTHYMVDALAKVVQYDLQGTRIRTIDLPGLGSIGGFSGKYDNDILYYSFTNYSTPNSSYAFNIETGVSTLHYTPTIAYNPKDYESKQVFYTSKDGTRIPMMITHKKGIERTGKNPTILYGYGGFHVSLTPAFSIATLVWMEQGGIYAVPNLRGGGEYGKAWHNAGTKLQKQNVFDDFIAAADYLIAHQYTSPQYLAIKGGSNGGLLVGATMTQRPDLMAVALPAVGVLDMLRYHTFTAGAGWAYDYGTAADNETMFQYLKTYSPLHAIREGVHYPATLITTADHDDRVVPAHSFKFAAMLQEKQTGSNPIHIRIAINAGHGAGKSTTETIAEYADVFAFTLHAMGYLELPNRLY